MFETSLIDLGDKAKRVQTRRWLSFPVAVGIHLAVAASVAFAAYWNIAEVHEPPVMDVFFVQQELPPPGPPASPPGPPEPAPAPAPRPVVAPEEPVQPQTVPDEVPVAPSPAPVPTFTFTGPTEGAGDTSGGGNGPGVEGSVGPGGGGCVGPECGDGPASPVPVVAEAPPGNAPIAVRGAVTKPETLFRVQPAYTEAARRVRLTGAVIVRAIIDEQGRVTDVQLVKGLPMGLDRSAMDAVRQWRFTPATLHGRPVKVYFDLTVRFEVR